ncbi:hypothetical protein ASD64_14720 [Mesorhizobium sp. Root157]|uniref:hypothetical protein n=1 Tax=Mesorhizobium sp. Root157 TaxID=1736477 RepID=UPI0006FCAB7F|nr:hypothetical protein [Mesorhizobium sp. Root157]KQZ99581.1 hypothetical protein ASD64_14720 [Mesorhizobium sp. Root157]
MNQHSIPTDIHRRLGLDNIDLSGAEGDRRLADLEAKAKEAIKALVMEVRIYMSLRAYADEAGSDEEIEDFQAVRVMEALNAFEETGGEEE